MKLLAAATIAFSFLLCSVAQAKPIETTSSWDKLKFLDNTQSDLSHRSKGAHGVLRLAMQDTTFFGGTVWAADSSRWEALEDSCWTFDTGVGSHFDHSAPHVNPFKSTALHASMEGWVGVDNSYGGVNPYFRRLVEADFTGAVCVGATGGLGGTGSLYAGVLPSEASALCYASGQGYGNNWFVTIEKAFAGYAGGNVTLSYDYISETEPNFDYIYCNVDTSGFGDLVNIDTFTGPASGTGGGTLVQGVDLPFNTGGSIIVQFTVASDGAYSDADGLYPSTCGAFAIDNVSLSGAINDVSDFETGDNGWSLSAPSAGAGGEWSDIVALADLPAPLTNCACDLSDSVLVFKDGNNGHSIFKDNVAVSPWIDLVAAGLDGSPGKLIEANLYTELPLLNYIFVQFNVQWYPQICTNTGLEITSDFTSNGFVYYFGGVPQCTAVGAAGTQIEFSDVMDPGAQQVRIAVGVISYCRFFTGCSGITNTTPWFDCVSLGVYGDPDAPFLTASGVDLPFDSFPQNGTLNPETPGRVDSNNVKGDTSPEIGTSLGDTLIVSGGGVGGGNNTNTEVYIQFAVDFGPGAPELMADTWLTSHTNEGSWNGQTWYSARLDTAEQGGVVSNATTWMSAYHEEDPNFSGNDRDLDVSDLDPNGLSRLENDIFPEGSVGLFTMGSRVNLFYKARYVDTGGTPTTNVWFTFPDTSGGNYLEMEVLPSSTDSSGTWNCVLYVDHFNRGAQGPIEAGLTSIMGVASSGNFELTPWDRFDVRAETSQQGSFGRPLNTQYNANVLQIFAYKAIIWNSGNLGAFNLVEEDASVLIPWLTLVDSGLGFNNLYVSGDGAAQSMTLEAAVEPSALLLLNQWMGVDFTCGTVRDAGCPSGSVIDEVACIEVNSAGGAFVGNDNSVVLQGNGCPELRSFDVVTTQVGAAGSPTSNEAYAGPLKGVVNSHSISNAASGGPDYLTVLDGASVHYRRDEATCTDTQSQVTDRLSRVLTYFGYATSLICQGPPVGGTPPDPPRSPRVILSNFAPNPLNTDRGKISFTMPQRADAIIEVFDVNGRLVRTLFDSVADVGENEVFWDGTDASGASVASGVYFYQLRVKNGDNIAKKMLVIQNGGR